MSADHQFRSEASFHGLPASVEIIGSFCNSIFQSDLSAFVHVLLPLLRGLLIFIFVFLFPSEKFPASDGFPSGPPGWLPLAHEEPDIRKATASSGPSLRLTLTHLLPFDRNSSSRAFSFFSLRRSLFIDRVLCPSDHAPNSSAESSAGHGPRGIFLFPYRSAPATPVLRRNLLSANNSSALPRFPERPFPVCFPLRTPF